MARAGYCSTCGENVYLTPTGGCPKGHGPECVSNVYEAPDAAPPQYAPQQAYQPPAAYPAQPVPTQPKRRRTGLIVTLVLLALLAVCGCAGFGLFALAGSGSKGGETKADPAKARTEVALRMFKGLYTGDESQIESAIASDAVAAALELEPTFIKGLASTGKEKHGKILTEEWSGATVVVTATNSEGDATMTLSPSKAEPTGVVISTVKADSPPTSVNMNLAQQGADWYMVSFTVGGQTIPFDKEGLVKLLKGIATTP